MIVLWLLTSMADGWDQLVFFLRSSYFFLFLTKSGTGRENHSGESGSRGGHWMAERPAPSLRGLAGGERSENKECYTPTIGFLFKKNLFFL